MIQRLLASNRARIERDLRDSPRRGAFSAALLSQYRVTVPMIRRGGLFSFLSHQVSSATVGLVWGVPILGRVCLALNEWLAARPSLFLDTHLGPMRKFPLGYTVAVRKLSNEPRPPNQPVTNSTE